MLQLLFNIQQRLIGNVLYKFSLIFCSLYVVLFYGKTFGKKVVFYLFISMLLSTGVAGLGYAMNDIKDYKDDLQNKKPNLFNKFSKLQSVSLIVLFILLATFPWFYLPTDRNTFYLLAIEFALFFIYAFPPFRLKEKGISGILTDALYAQVIPCLLAVYTFSKIANTQIDYKLITLYALWLLLVGIRNIIKHQIEDFKNDTNTNTNTFVIKYGIDFSKNISIVNFFIPELILFSIILFFINFQFHFVLIIYLFYIIFMFIKRNKNSDNNLYNFINQRILNEFYEIYLPIILLIYFSYFNPFFLILLCLNVVFFNQIYLHYLKGFYKKYF